MSSGEVTKIASYTPATTGFGNSSKTVSISTQAENLSEMLSSQSSAKRQTPEIPDPVMYKIQSGDCLEKIAKEYNTTVEAILAANPQIKDKNRIVKGQSILIPYTPAKSQKTENTPKEESVQKTKASKSSTQKEFEATQSDAVKALRNSIGDVEGIKHSTYFAAEGKTTIGYGHQLTDKNKPAFLKAIENEPQSSINNKTKKFQEALKDPMKAQLFRNALQKDLQDAAQNTGIKDVKTEVRKDLVLTDEQIKLLLNSDLKKAETATVETIGEKEYNRATTKQKQVALSLQYNTGSLSTKAPKFVQYFKEGKMDKAQAELDVFKANGTVQLGLIRRRYSEMLMMDENQIIYPDSQRKLLKAYNQYSSNNNRAEALSYREIVPIINHF